MGRLLRDRYYEYAPDQAWELATGQAVDVTALPAEPPSREPPVAPLVEVLDHGREGAPRWIVTEMTTTRGWMATARAAAEDARSRGFVPIAVDLYLRLRTLAGEELRDRALVLIAPPDMAVERARRALVDAAMRSPRPHVLLTFRLSIGLAGTLSGSQQWERRGESLSRGMVREARAVYGAQPLRPRPQASLPDDVARQVTRGSRSAEFIAAGRDAAADRLLRDVAAALVRRRAFPQAADAYVSLGRLLLERGRAVDAEATFSEAASHAESGGDEVLSRGARIWQAAARTDAAQLTGAESLCRAVLLTGGPSDDEHARAEATLARVLLWQSRADEAATLGFVNARDATSFVDATAVRVLLERGKLFEAGQ